MIVMFTYSRSRQEIKAISALGEDIASILSEEDWDFPCCCSMPEFIDYLNTNPSVDISCVDVESKGAVSSAGRLRELNPDMYLILLTSPEVSPATYIRPNILAGSLLMRPLSKPMIKTVLNEAFREYLNSFYGGSDSSFIVKNNDGRRLVPYKNIVFFESRNKKIYLNTGTDEMSFYDTLDNLDDRLGDEFIRCHRSFIVSKLHIKRIVLSKNIIETDCGFSVPLSRSYKTALKEMKK